MYEVWEWGQGFRGGEVVEVREGVTASFLWGLPVCQMLSWAVVCLKPW